MSFMSKLSELLRGLRGKSEGDEVRKPVTSGTDDAKSMRHQGKADRDTFGPSV